MINAKTTAWHFFLTSRPYSYACNISRGVMVVALLGLADNLAILTASVVTSLLMWIYLNWSSEIIQQNSGRLQAHWSLPFVPLVLTFFTAYFTEPNSIPILALFSIVTLFYPLKAIAPSVGIYGPLLRGCIIALHIAFIASLTDKWQNFDLNLLLISSILVILHIARNLVGDIRDVCTDKFEFPKRLGLPMTTMCLRFLFFSAAALSILLPAKFSFVTYSISILWLAIEMNMTFFENRPEIYGYIGHQLFIIIYSLIQITIAYQAGIDLYVCAVLLLIFLPTQLLYRKTPGKRYPNMSDIKVAMNS